MYNKACSTIHKVLMSLRITETFYFQISLLFTYISTVIRFDFYLAYTIIALDKVNNSFTIISQPYIYDLYFILKRQTYLPF